MKISKRTDANPFPQNTFATTTRRFQLRHPDPAPYHNNPPPQGDDLAVQTTGCTPYGYRIMHTPEPARIQQQYGGGGNGPPSFRHHHQYQNTMPLSQTTTNASLSGKHDGSGSCAVAAMAAMATRRALGYVDVGDTHRELYVPPGRDQLDTLEHRAVHANNRCVRDPHQKTSYTQPGGQDEDVACYSKRLYHTPCDSTKNVISTGILRNPYTGDVFETFENQLPPPNTNKGEIPTFQLKQINPRLLHLSGGYNHHHPPPRKKEHMGEVFKPTDILGGANVWGSQLYDTEVRNKLQMLASRDLYNNRDGLLVGEPSMIGEKPAGFIGHVPITSFRPYIPPTQELELNGRTQIAENQEPDMRKREQYTGEVFSRRANVLVTNRAVAPDTFINGVMAVGKIPIATEHAGTQRGTLQAYITPAFYDGAPHIHAVHLDRPGRVFAETPNPMGPFDTASNQHSFVAIDREVHGRLMEGQTTRLAENPQQQAAGGLLTSQVNIRPTAKLETSFPTGPAHIQHTGNLPSDVFTIRPTMEVGTFPTLPPSGMNENAGHIPMEGHTTARDTLRSADGAFPQGPVVIPSHHAALAMDHHTIRDTQKGTLAADGRGGNLTAVQMQDTAFIVQDTNRATLKGTIPMLSRTSNIHGVVQEGIATMETHTVRPTGRVGPALPLMGINAVARGDLVINQQTIRDTLKAASVEDAFRLNPVHRAHMGALVLNTSGIQDTLTGHGEVVPLGPVCVSAQPGYVQLDNTTRETFAGHGDVAPSGPVCVSVVQPGYVQLDHTIRETLAGHGDSAPAGQVSASVPQGYVHVDKTTRDTLVGHGEAAPPGPISTHLAPGHIQLETTARDTQRQTMPTNTHGASVDGESIGHHVGPGSLTTLPQRGVSEQEDTTQTHKVLDGVGGSAAKVLGDSSAGIRHDSVRNTYTNAEVVPLKQLKREIAPFRPTLRDRQDTVKECESREQ